MWTIYNKCMNEKKLISMLLGKTGWHREKKNERGIPTTLCRLWPHLWLRRPLWNHSWTITQPLSWNFHQNYLTKRETTDEIKNILVQTREVKIRKSGARCNLYTIDICFTEHLFIKKENWNTKTDHNFYS